MFSQRISKAKPSSPLAHSSVSQGQRGRVKDAIGPGIDLMADANGRWLFPDVFDFSRRVADLHLKWLEEPIWYDDVEGHRSWRRGRGLCSARCREAGIPWLKDCFEEPATVSDGYFATPWQPGAGSAIRPQAFDKYRVGEWSHKPKIQCFRPFGGQNP